jgi:hypothetical protein
MVAGFGAFWRFLVVVFWALSEERMRIVPTHPESILKCNSRMFNGG